jgi:hypothetical protein
MTKFQLTFSEEAVNASEGICPFRWRVNFRVYIS